MRQITDLLKNLVTTKSSLPPHVKARCVLPPVILDQYIPRGL